MKSQKKRSARRISKIIKRDGSIVTFAPLKIENAILKAIKAVKANEKLAKGLTEQVVDTASVKFDIPSVEQIQDVVEDVLVKNHQERIAKAYMLYRQSRAHAREIKDFFGIKDDLKFGVNAIKVLEERYLLRDEEGKIIETPTEMFRRVAKAVSVVEKNKQKEFEEKFFNIMKNLEFLPNSPTLMNAGTKLGQLSACFVLPIEDSLESIFNTLKQTAIIQQSGGGTGFNFSKIRPNGDIVKSTKGIASGPISFIKIFDETTETIKQGGKRRGANMAVLNISHPDILEFITSKEKEKQLSNFNISASVDDKFMSALQKNEDYHLINPRTGKIQNKVNAKKIFDAICKAAWQTGDPGMIFIDEINRKNQLPGLGNLETTNPCGEVPLFSYESCNLGSINLTKMLKENGNKSIIDWNKLKNTVHLSIKFLDDVIDVNKYPFAELEKIAKANRRIGLGVMGFAEMLILLEIPYESQQAIQTAEKIMSFIEKESHLASVEIAKEKGNFENFEKSIWKTKTKYMRNCACTTIAPTGTISIIAGCSSGIEPLFAIAFMREILAGKHLFEVNKIFLEKAIKEGFYSDDLMKEIVLNGSLKKVKMPEKAKKLFKTALEISAEQHVEIQSSFQKYTDNAVSKTINLPNNASIEEIKKAYILAYKTKCKGITVYRYGSKPEQVLYLGEGKRPTKASIEFTGGTCIGKVCTF